MAKIKDGFVMRQVAGQSVVIAVGEASRDFHGMINLNDSGSCIWKGLEDGLSPEEIADRLTEEFEVDAEIARADTCKMMNKMKELGILEG